MTEPEPPNANAPDTDTRTDHAEAVSPAVNIDEVAVELGDVNALNRVSALVKDGKFLGFIGPNGAGKTTLLRTITGAISPTSGAIYIDGSRVEDLSSKEVSRNVAVVPQDTSLAFDFNVRQIISMGRTPYIGRFAGGQGTDRQAVERAMKRTDVEQFAERSVSEVSGGERQRILLARAIAQDTPVLLLDEPTASLDINHQVRTLELVRQLVDGGKTVIAAIHDLNLAARFCDELLLLDEGRVMDRGTPENVLTSDNVEKAFNSSAVISRNPVTDSVTVSAFTPPKAFKPTAKVHVLCGGGCGRRILYELWTNGFEVTVGPLPKGDADLETAKYLDLETVVTNPFQPITPVAKSDVEQMIQDADVTIIAGSDVSPGNVRMLELASTSDCVFWSGARAQHECDHAGEVGSKLFEELADQGTSVTFDELIPTLRRHLETVPDDGTS